MRVSPRSGVSSVALVIILVIVLAAAAVGAYIATRPTSTSTSSTSVTGTVQQTTTSTPTSASSTGITTTSTTPPTSTSSATTPATSTTGTSTITAATCEGTTVQTTNTESNQLTAAFDAISEFRAVSYELNITSHSSTTHETFSYLVTPSTGGLSLVNVTVTVAINSTSEVTSDLAWVNVGSMSVVNITQYVKSDGKTYSLGTQTGVEAETTFAPAMAEFTVYNTEYGVEYYSYLTNAQYFHSTGTASMTFGPTTFDVTTYLANNTPEVFNACGNTFTLNQWDLQIGTPPGTSTIFVTYLQSVGSEVVNGVPVSNNFTLALTSLTLA